MKIERENIEMKQKAVEFAKELCLTYFENRDYQRLLSYMEQRTSWIGTGEDELSHNFTEAKQALMEDVTEYEGKFHLEAMGFDAEPLSDSMCIVYGSVKAIPEDRTLSGEALRLSLVLEQKEDEFRLVHMHFSHADPGQEKGRYFVTQKARLENQTLRSELNTREHQIENLMKHIPGGVHQCMDDPQFTLLSISTGFFEMFGYTNEEVENIFHNQFMNMIYPEDRAKLRLDIEEQLSKGPNLELEYRVMHKDGRLMWVLDKGRMLKDEYGRNCFYSVVVDITDRKYQEELLRLALESHQIIMDQVTDIIFEWNIARDTLKFSPNWKKRFGYEAIKEDISNQIPCSANIYKDDMRAFLKIMRDTAQGVPYSETEFRIKDNRGDYMWCRIRATTQFDGEGKAVKAIGVIVDIDEEKRQKQELLERVKYDAHTGLYNKTTINTLVKQSMLRSHHANCQALMIIDIDHFKAVNDNYGHLCGDIVLSRVAEVLKNMNRSTDFVGRIGGDEFLVYLPEILDEECAMLRAVKILNAIQDIIPAKGASAITCSIGIALCKGESSDYYKLYQNADHALYQKKNEGRAGISLFRE